MDFSDIASVSGKGTLFKVIQPTRTGVILESLDEHKKKMVATMHNKVSILSEISIYTTDAEGAVPLEDVMRKIHKEFDGDTDLDKNSSSEELKAFLKFILPDYDEGRVYVSDIKKVVSWYDQLVKQAPEVLVEKKEEKKAPKKTTKKEEPKGE
ncbi:MULTISPECIES: DUF5606 domain-containing protein [unclassified Ekhidna]|jgi:hypothetical protein|uniref:DUF5606 family protein n=1 Tax=unclassified Ekhidna TaxID=2632188 RepID=UPI0032DE484A